MSRTIAADKEIEQQYPSVIQDLTARVESNPVTSGGVKTALDAKAAKSEIIKTSTGLTDSADLMRYSDTLTINGGGVS